MKRAFGRNYLFEKSHWAFILGLFDSLGYMLMPSRGRQLPEDVRKILVSRIDHLGDVLIASSILPYLKKRWPLAEIHFLAGRWAEEFLRMDPHVKRIVIYNSPRLNRNGGFLARLFDASLSLFSAVRILKRERYDLAIDLRAYSFNSIPIMYIGGAGYIVGFSTGGWGFLLNRRVPYRTGVHEIVHIVDVLKELGIDADEDGIKPRCRSTEAGLFEAGRLLEDLGVDPDGGFVLLHTGSGNPRKLWTPDRWQRVVDWLKVHHDAEVVLYDSVYGDGLKGCRRLPVRLSLESFMGVVERSSLFVGLDSFPAHLAASLGKPAVVVWCGINDPVQWRPIGSIVRIVKRDVECAPCRNERGCSTMECMDIDVEGVLNAIDDLMKYRKMVRTTGTST